MTRGRIALALVALALASVRLVGGGVGAQAPAAPAQTTPPTASSSCTGPRVYAGSPIDVDFQGSDLRTTLRLLADTGGINLVLDPSVSSSAKVDIKLTQVPIKARRRPRGQPDVRCRRHRHPRAHARRADARLDDETKQRLASERARSRTAAAAETPTPTS